MPAGGPGPFLKAGRCYVDRGMSSKSRQAPVSLMPLLSRAGRHLWERGGLARPRWGLHHRRTCPSARAQEAGRPLGRAVSASGTCPALT